MVMTPREAEEFTALWTYSQAEVAAFIRSILPDAEAAQEVLQQVAVQLVRHFDRYDSSLSFTAWAIGTAKHEVLAFRRRQATDRLVFGEAFVEQLAETFQRTSDADQPMRGALQECLEQTDARGRQALELYYGHGWKTAEVADALAISHGALRMQLCRLRNALRDCIERRLAGGES